MNRKGQVLILGIMVMIVCLILGVIFTQPIKDQIDLVRDSSHLDCSNTSIGTGTRLTCLVFDIYLPYFIGFILFGSAGYIISKKLTS